MSIVLDLPVIAAIASSILGVVGGLLASKKLFSKKSFGPSNAIELLEIGKIEEWNEVRVLHPDWNPSLEGINLSGNILSSANFSDAKFSNVDLSHSDLVGCNFSNSVLVNVSFSHSELRDTLFEGASGTDVDLTDAKLDGVDFSNAEISSKSLENVQTIKMERHLAPSYKTLEESQNSELVLDEIHKMSPVQFENFLAELFSMKGYKIERSSTKHDRGYDLLALTSDPIMGERRVLVEAKKYSRGRLVGVSSVRSLLGVVRDQDANAGVLVATGRISQTAREIADSTSEIMVIDENELVNLVLGKN